MLIWSLLVGGGWWVVSILNCKLFCLGSQQMIVNIFFNFGYNSIQCHPSFSYAVVSWSSLYIFKGGTVLVSSCLCGTSRTCVYTVDMGPSVLSSIDAMAWFYTLIISMVSPLPVGVVTTLIFSVSPLFAASTPTSAVLSALFSSVGITSSLGLSTLDVPPFYQPPFALWDFACSRRTHNGSIFTIMVLIRVFVVLPYMASAICWPGSAGGGGIHPSSCF